jgi:hypothetical protein
MCHYMIWFKLKLNLHGNNKLHMYWTYSKKKLLKYPYMICCKLKLNLHGNNKLHVYWTYSKQILLKYPYLICYNKNSIYKKNINYACIEHTHY